MAFFKKRRALSLGAKTIPIGTGIAAAIGGLIVAYLRWFRPGVAAELTGTRTADNPSAPVGSGTRAGTDPGVAAGSAELAARFHGLDRAHAATHYPPSLERDAKNIEQSIHEG